MCIFNFLIKDTFVNNHMLFSCYALCYWTNGSLYTFAQIRKTTWMLNTLMRRPLPNSCFPSSLLLLFCYLQTTILYISLFVLREYDSYSCCSNWFFYSLCLSAFSALYFGSPQKLNENKNILIVDFHRLFPIRWQQTHKNMDFSFKFHKTRHSMQRFFLIMRYCVVCLIIIKVFAFF